ncbi:uncharacterized protein H6S33_006402 [Morchella sextelata]|uniref:uncharacterized protein n=1 Tax=Morchella sextelata TaxID=1174677 RepID=UPI001D0506CE|nr:uncharacterized protein H6S33_006402 [Morchella sextelata]KAH0604734.1 hypothetical protein H6S33_006402 [Morchella sextelata]
MQLYRSVFLAGIGSHRDEKSNGEEDGGGSIAACCLSLWVESESKKPNSNSDIPPVVVATTTVVTTLTSSSSRVSSRLERERRCCEEQSEREQRGEDRDRLGEMPIPGLRLKQRVLDVQAYITKRRNSHSTPQPPERLERSSSPLTARLSLSSSSSNAVEIKNDHQSRASIKSAPGERPTSTDSTTTAPRGEGSGTAGSSSRNGSAVIILSGAPKSQNSPTQQQPTPCPPTQLTPPLPPLASPPTPSEPPIVSKFLENGDQDSPHSTPEISPVASPAASITTTTPVVTPASPQAVDSAFSFQPPRKEKSRAARPEFQQPLPHSIHQAQNAAYIRRPSQLARRQSLFPNTEGALIQNLLDPDGNNQQQQQQQQQPVPEENPTNNNFHSAPVDFHPLPTPATLGPEMPIRKVWVKRPGGSPTTVSVRNEDMVDDVRDVVLKKYQNALGRSYDAPDITLRIFPRHPRPRSLDHNQNHNHHGYNNHISVERMLNPDETLVHTLDEYFPGGQSIDEALVIDVPPLPLRKTPRPSPHTYAYGSTHESHLGIESNEYFPPMPLVPSSHNQSQIMNGGPQNVLSGPSIAVLTTGQVSNLPGSPGGGTRRGPARPGTRRLATSSPTIHASGPGVATAGTVMRARSRGNSDAANRDQPPPPPPIPTPPTEDIPQTVQTPPPARVASPLSTRIKKDKKQHASPAGLLPDGAVPPINVLIVEDNVINLRLLEAFMKRLKVRWQSAMNGKEAVEKWRAGGFHLVLMDIQLPVMNGLEATKEIRRLERVNSIGFQDPPLPKNAVLSDEDKLPNSILFKSPVIIVALTASSLQSDRHEALAAGCNDFLTKPVNFIWLERKVTEWGCMQALIDFDGWRKWKDFTNNNAGASDGKVKPRHGRQMQIARGAAAAEAESRRLDASSPITTVG